MILNKYMPTPVWAPETLTGRFAADTFPKPGVGWSTQLVPVFGNYLVPAAVEDGDIFEMCWTPKNFLAMMGIFQAFDMDTGTEALDMDLGWAANGGASTETLTTADGTVYTNAAHTADPDGLLNMGLWSGDVITDLLPAGNIWRPINLQGGFFFSRPTMIQVEANVAGNAHTAGSMSVLLLGTIIG